MATHSSILAWKIPWMEELGRLQSIGSQTSNMNEQLSMHTRIPVILSVFMLDLTTRKARHMVRSQCLSFFLFNWGIIALQSCMGFCHTTLLINHKYTHVPSLLIIPPHSTPSYPSRLLQSSGLNYLCYTALATENVI